jgi:hypothetical protein
VVPTYQQEHVNDDFGLFDDDDEDNLTLFGKMIIMIKLGEKKTRFLIEYQSFYFMLE